MTCSQCGKEFVPAQCEGCGTVLPGGTCPDCSGSVTCPNCGKEVVASNAAPAGPGEAPTQGVPIPPPEANAPAPPLAEEGVYTHRPTEMPPQAPQGYDASAQPNTANPVQQPVVPPPPSPSNMGGMPGGQMPPYGAPQGGRPPMGAPGMPGPYGMGPVPTQKVPLGGWLMLFFVLTCIGLGFNLISLIYTVFTVFNMVSLIIALGSSILFSILPAIMMIFYITQRDIKFKYWYYFSAIVSFVSYAFILVGIVAMNSLLGADPALMDTAMAASGYGGMMDSLPPDFLSSFMTGFIIGFTVVVIIGVGITVAWWVYFNKSRRVAYTFDPRNNPPT